MLPGLKIVSVGHLKGGSVDAESGVRMGEAGGKGTHYFRKPSMMLMVCSSSVAR